MNILLSVRPEWLAKILNGEKTVEIRKSVPKLPCEVYLYCTKKEHTALVIRKGEMNYGEVMDKPIFVKAPDAYWQLPLGVHGKVVAKFTLKEAEKITFEVVDYYTPTWDGYYAKDELLEKAKITIAELNAYGNGNPLYAWHITDLVIFEKPMELWQFNQKGFPHSTDYTAYENNEPRYYHHITRAPQSWQYVEVKE